MDQSVSDQVFLARLANADETELLVVDIFRRHYRYVLLPPKRTRPSYEERHKYRDDGDMAIYIANRATSGMLDGKPRRIEAKGNGKTWTDADTFRDAYPSKPRNLMICNAPSYDRARLKPSLYVIVEKNRAHVALVPTLATRDRWFTRDRFVPEYGYTETIYHVPLECVTFRSVAFLYENPPEEWTED